MAYLFALLGALAVATIPISLLGWEPGEQSMAAAMGLAQNKRRVDLAQIARESGTGLTADRLLMGMALWVVGGFIAGLPYGFVVAVMFALGGGFVYWGGLSDKREDRRAKQSVQIARAMGIIETVLSQGRPLQDALEQAAEASPPEGREVLEDLVRRIREAPANEMARAIREWDEDWDNPSVDMLAAALLAAIEARIEIAPLVHSLRENIQDVSDVLNRTRSEAAGIVWQAKFLAFWPLIVLALLSFVAPEWAIAYHRNPLLILPVLLGSAATWWLSMRQIRTGLSVDASVGIGENGEGEIQLDRLGKIL